MTVTVPSLELNPVGDEFQINTTAPTSTQSILSPEVAPLENGNYAVVWQLIEPGSWIQSRMRVFDADGNEVRAEFNLGTSHYASDVTALSDNRFATVSIDSSDSFNAKIHIFDASGNETSVVSAGSAGGWAYGSPDIEPLDNGGFVVSWRSNSTANDSASFRIYDASGSPTTNAISFGGSNPTNERATKIQELDNGELVTVYQSGDDLFFQRWSSTGTAIGSATAVNTTTADTQSQFNIETLPDGGFFVIWKSSGGQDGDGQGIVGRRFDASGTAVTDEIIINSTTAGEQFDPQLARLSNGALEALWTSDHTGDNEIFGSTIALGAGAGPNQVQENAMNGLLVGKAAVSDFDDPDTHTYTLVNDAGGRFAIDANTGNISVADGTLLDHETNDSHTVRVRVTDNGGLFSEQDIVIQVQDVNEAPDVSGPMTITAPQNLATHTVSQAFLLTNASDEDDGDTLNVQDVSINGITAHRHDFQASVSSGTGTVSVNDDTITITGATGASVALIDTTGGSTRDTDLHLDFTVTPTSNNATRNGHIVFDYVDANNFKTIGSYDGSGTSTWRVESWTNGSSTALADYNSSDSSNINTPRHYEIDIINNRISLTVDGVEKVAHQFSENISDGQLGVMANGSAVTTFTLNGPEWDIYPDNEHAVYDNNDGTWTIMPGDDLSGDLTLDYNVSDGELTTAATATLPVERTADITINLTQTSVTDDVLPVETTFQGNPLTVTSVNGQAVASSGTTSINGEFGTLDIAADGSWTYTPDSAYAGVDLDSNLIAEWNFDGNANDNAPSDSIADNGVLTGNAAYTNDSVSGSAVTLDGTGDYVQIATTTELGNYATPPSQRTISLFFKLDPSNSKDGKQVLYEEAGSSNGFAIYLDNGKIYVGGWENSNTAYVNTDITYLDSDNWHHIALVMNDDANTLRGFLDGEIFGNAAGITVPAHTGTVAFGSPSEGNQAFDFHDLDDGVGTQFHGLVDEGRVYNRALTEAEVQVMGQLDQTETFTYEVSDGTHTSTSNLEINTLHTLDSINDLEGSNGVNDTLNGTLFSERLRGLDGNDTLNAGGGDDRIIGGIGDDILTGGSGEDVFKFNIGDIGTAAIPAQDTITDFNMSEGDSLDLRSILVDEENNDLTQYLSFDQTDPANPIVEVRDTAGGDITQKITLQGVDLSLLGSTDAEIINSMLNSGNLSTD